jgi:hypothetical protein
MEEAVKLRGLLAASTMVVVAGASLLATGAEAHHSAAMFDKSKTVTLAGTVKELQWTSPHCWIQLMAPGDTGLSEWSIEMGAPFELLRNGIRQSSLKPGDKITVVINPTRSGSKGGLFVSAMDGAGQPIGTGH